MAQSASISTVGDVAKSFELPLVSSVIDTSTDKDPWLPSLLVIMSLTVRFLAPYIARVGWWAAQNNRLQSRPPETKPKPTCGG